MKVGAGVQGFEAVEAANAAGLVVVTGECATVGMAGGYIQGGGHSALSTQFGMGADQALEYEVVTAAGSVVTASASTNPDLFWALSGGGPSTYGIVTSVTVRAYPSLTIGGARIQLASAYTTPDNFYKAVSIFHSLIPRFTDAGAVLAYLVSKDYLVLGSATVYNSSAAYVQNMLTPFTSALRNLSIPFSQTYTEQSYRDHYNQYFGPLPYGAYEVAAYNFGGRLIPRSVLESNNPGYSAVVRNLTEHGATLGNVALNASKIPSGVSNSVFAGWRKASIHMQITTPYNSSASMQEILAAQAQITNEFQPQIEAVTPGAGAYMNEADYRTPDFKTTFFGSNYNALLAIKRRWDPNGLLYGLKLVGSDQWTVSKDGRMCRA